jgi:phosphoribosylformylglycinamidine cyclo-ligase
VLPKSVDAVLLPGSWEVPAVFERIRERSGADALEMHRAFNMGVGLCLVVSAADADAALESLEGARVIGAIEPGTGRVLIPGVTEDDS